MNVRSSFFANLAVSIMTAISAKIIMGVSLIAIMSLLQRVDHQHGICAVGVEGEHDCSFIRKVSECSIKFKPRVG